MTVDEIADLVTAALNQYVGEPSGDADEHVAQTVKKMFVEQVKVIVENGKVRIVVPAWAYFNIESDLRRKDGKRKEKT